MAVGLGVLVFVSCLLAPDSQLVFADIVYFTAGDSIKGLVVEEHHDRIVLSTEQGERIILRRDIDEIFYDEPERNYLYLGRQALEQGEFALSRGFYQKALQTNPELKEAEEALHRLEDEERKITEAVAPDVLDALWRRWGLALETVSGSTVVSRVREHSPAEEAGFEPSDVLTAYWDESLLFLPAQEVAERLVGPAGSDVKVSIRRVMGVPPAIESSAGRPALTGRNWPGWKLEMERLGLTVRQVSSDGAARLMGVKPGDRILELNDQPTRYLPLGQARGTIQKSKENGLALVIDRDLMIRRE